MLDHVFDAAFGACQIAAPAVQSAAAPVGREDGHRRTRAHRVEHVAAALRPPEAVVATV
jgi:hypothetical protein